MFAVIVPGGESHVAHLPVKWEDTSVDFASKCENCWTGVEYFTVRVNDCFLKLISLKSQINTERNMMRVKFDCRTNRKERLYRERVKEQY